MKEGTSPSRSDASGVLIRSGEGETPPLQPALHRGWRHTERGSSPGVTWAGGSLPL